MDSCGNVGLVLENRDEMEDKDFFNQSSMFGLYLTKKEKNR